jgi:hypothetical protein
MCWQRMTEARSADSEGLSVVMEITQDPEGDRVDHEL